MKLTLYNSIADANYLDKTKKLTEIITLNGTLRNTCSVLAPAIIIDLNPTKEASAPGAYQSLTTDDGTVTDAVLVKESTIITANYAFIEEFNRYYFITDVIAINSHLWQLTLRCDVLMSYKDIINNKKAFVYRNQFTYDENIKDDELLSIYKPSTSVEDTYYYTFPNELINVTFNTDVQVVDRNITITVINNDPALPITGIKNPLTGSNISPWVAGQGITNTTYVTTINEVQKLYKYLLSHESDKLSSYVLAINSYPFTIPGEGQLKKLVLGNTTTDILVSDLKTQVSDMLVLADFEYDLDNEGHTYFHDNEPYTKIEFYIPYVGWIQLESRLVLSKRLIVSYSIDYATGQAQAYVWNYNDKSILFTSSCQLGIQVPVIQSNAFELHNNMLVNNIGLGLNALAAVGALGVGAITANPLAIAGGVMSGARIAADYTAKSMQLVPSVQGSLSSGSNAVYATQEVLIRLTAVDILTDYYDDSSVWAKTHGYPLMQSIELNKLDGFTICEMTDKSLPTATATEIDEIDALLKSGIIL